MRKRRAEYQQCLGLTWVVPRRDNNTPGLVIHFITNGVGLLPIFLGVLGI